MILKFHIFQVINDKVVFNKIILSSRSTVLNLSAFSNGKIGVGGIDRLRSLITFQMVRVSTELNFSLVKSFLADLILAFVCLTAFFYSDLAIE